MLTHRAYPAVSGAHALPADSPEFARAVIGQTRIMALTELAALAFDELWLIGAGAVLVVLIVLAFILGQRYKDKEPPPVDLRFRPRRRRPPK